VILLVVLLGGLVIGLLAGRWWIVFAPVAFGAWVATATEVDEVPPWFLGLAYGLAAVIGAVVGVYVRRVAVRRRL
jgi:hypothetical protein